MRLHRGGIALATTALVLYAVWPSSPSRSTAPAASPSAATRAPHQLDRRLRDDANGLARAFSMMAARTLGTVIIAGRVVNRDTGAGIPGAEVIFTGPSGESSSVCDGDGAYRAELLPGLYRGYAQADGYVAVARAAAERLPGPVSAAAVAMPRDGIAPLVGVFRDQLGVTLSLGPAARIEGTVKDQDGSSISGAIIAGHAANEVRVISGSDVSESDGSGAYELLVPAGSVQLEAHHQDYAALLGGDSLYLRPGQRLHRDLILGAGCIVEGQVIDSHGNPVLSGSFERMWSDGSYFPIGKIDDGAVRFAMQGQGEVTLRAWPWKSPPSEDRTYACADGESFRNETFVIPEAKPTLTGRVEDSDGQPVPFAFVDIFGLEPGGGTQQERADAQGAFAFFTLPEGPYQISSYVAGKGAVLTFVDAPSTGVPLRLEGVGSIIGSITGLDTGSIRMRYRCVFDYADAEATRGDQVSMPVQSLLVPVSSGRFRIDDLPACPIQGELKTGQKTQSFSVLIEEKQEAILRLNTNSPHPAAAP